MGAAPTVVLPRRVITTARSLTKADLDRGTTLRNDSLVQANKPISDYRSERYAATLLRKLAVGNGLASTALINLLAMSAQSWSVKAYMTATQEFSREGLLAAESILSMWNTGWDYSTGFLDRPGLDLMIQTGLYEALLTGGVSAELVLDRQKLPTSLEFFPYDSIIWKANGKGGRYPYQKLQGVGEVDLNIPTVFVAEGMKDALSAYARPTMAAGAQELFQYQDFIQDMWRTIKRSGEPRLTATLNYEAVVNSAPSEYREDPKKMAEYLEEFRGNIETTLRNIVPEDAIVSYDLVAIGKIDASGEKKDFKDLLVEIAGLATSAMKSNASMLGMRSGGSQNVASTEAMMAVNMAQAMQKPVAEVLSKALTLAVRLMGVDVYVEFEFWPVNLRPEEELAAHRSMEQARVLELLSLGFVTDDEAQAMLRLGSRPEGAPELSGTMFYKNSTQGITPASATNARNASVVPGGPGAAGGSDNESRP